MSEFKNQKPRERDFLILTPRQKKEVLEHPSEYHPILRELIKSRRIPEILSSKDFIGDRARQMKFLINVYSEYYPFPKDTSGGINYDVVERDVKEYINEIIAYYEDLIEEDVPPDRKPQAELSEDVKDDVVELIILGNKDTRRGHEARLILSKLIDWMEINYREGKSPDEDMHQIRLKLNESFFLTDPTTEDIKESELKLRRFYDIYNFMNTVAYAIYKDDIGEWFCYDDKSRLIYVENIVSEGGGEVKKKRPITLDELRAKYHDQNNIFEEETSREVRFFNNSRNQQEEVVYYHPRSKETLSASAKMHRLGTRDFDEIYDTKGQAVTVESVHKVHTCEQALSFIWDIPGIQTDTIDSFHGSTERPNKFSAPGMQMVKYRVLRPYKCEIIIDTFLRNLNEREACSLINHDLYRYRQNMISGVYKRLLPHVDFTPSEIRKWVDHKILNFDPIREREPAIRARYGDDEGNRKIKEIKKASADLLYNAIMDIMNEETNANE